MAAGGGGPGIGGGGGGGGGVAITWAHVRDAQQHAWAESSHIYKCVHTPGPYSHSMRMQMAPK